jgi:hypothetical protein
MRALALAPVAAGAGEGLCLVPLEGGGPASGIEREQPWRIIGQSAALPGVPWVLVSPTNRGIDLYTVDGKRFERMDAEFPRGALWIVTITPPRADGSVYGWITPAYRPYRLYRQA